VTPTAVRSHACRVDMQAIAQQAKSAQFGAGGGSCTTPHLRPVAPLSSLSAAWYTSQQLECSVVHHPPRTVN
jgi:hypothetical protein